MLVALVANRGSGRGTEPEATVAALRNAGAVVLGPFGLDSMDAAARSGADRLVLASGDGAVGLGVAAAAAAGLPFALVPVGTANDFARALGIPTELEAACNLAVRGTRMGAIELGRMDSRAFVNAASAGLAVAAAERALPLKGLIGPLAYAAGAGLAALRSSPLQCRVKCDGEELWEGRAWQVTVACTGAFGGGSQIGAANPRDGQLDTIVITAGPRRRLALYGYGLRRGRISKQRGVRHAHAEQVQVDVPDDTHFTVDGEIIIAGSSSFCVERATVEVVVP